MLRPCRWVNAGTAEAVPGAIRRAFAGPFGTVTALTGDKERILNAGRAALGEPTSTLEGDIFDAAAPEDLEDLVALYLQSQGWRLLPSTAKLTMASYEFVMVHQETGERAGVQVKSGSVRSLHQSVAHGFDRFFVFMAHPNPMITSEAQLEVISRQEVERFALSNRMLLPRRLQLA